VFILSCGSETENEIVDNSTPTKQSLNFTFEFTENLQGFELNTANHLVNDASNASIDYGLRQLPSPFEFRQGLFFTWDTETLRIKGFIKRRLTGLKPNSSFVVDFDVDIISNIPSSCTGAAGSPGEGLVVSGAVFNEEPIRVIVNASPNSEYRVNIDNPDSTTNSKINIGNFALPVPCLTATRVDWEQKTIKNDDAFIFTSNSTGEAWMYISIDSIALGAPEIYILGIEMSISET